MTPWNQTRNARCGYVLGEASNREMGINRSRSDNYSLGPFRMITMIVRSRYRLRWQQARSRATTSTGRRLVYATRSCERTCHQNRLNCIHLPIRTKSPGAVAGACMRNINRRPSRTCAIDTPTTAYDAPSAKTSAEQADKHLPSSVFPSPVHG